MSRSLLLKSSSILPAFALFVWAGAGPAVAQAQTQPGQSGNDQDIIVTAQKRSESVQDVPATISAFSQQTIEARQIRGLGDLITQVPSLQVGSTFGSNNVTLRGISTNLSSGFEDPSIAVHVNGVYQSRARSLNLALMDLERIEVLSGPQGTLYGRNATGGVVNYILRRPTKDMEAEITGRVGNYDMYALQGFISGPINDKVGLRIVGVWDNRDKGYIKNLLAGAPKSSFGESKVAGIRGVLSFQPSDDLTVDLEGSFSHTRSSIAQTALNVARNAFWRPLVTPQSFEPRKVYSDLPQKMNTKQYAASATVSWDVSDNAQFKSISAYQKYHNNFVLDSDFSGFNGFSIVSPGGSRTYSQEFNLNTSLFDDRLKSVFGVFYFNDDVHQQTSVYSDPPVAPVPNGRIFRATMRQKAKSLAFFTDNTLSVTDRLRLIAGVRYNIDKKDEVVTIAPSCFDLETKQKFTSWTPRAGVQYDVADDIMGYATYQKGFKAGGVASGTCGNAYDPETIEGVEVGFKTSFADNRVRLNIAAYWYNYGNLQVQRTLERVGSFVVQNAAESRIKGIEGNLDASITDRLRLDVSAMVQSAKYTDYTNCDQHTFFGACGASDPRPPSARLEQLRGNWLNRAAPYSVNIGLQYEMPVAGGELTLRGESYWSGKIYYDEFASPDLVQHAYSLQNAFLSFTPESDRYTLRTFAKNIFNKDVRSGGAFAGTTNQDAALWSLPRTYGIEATYRF